MMDESEKIEQRELKELEQIAADRVKARVSDARWNLDIAIFAFAVLILVIILGFQRVGIEIVAPVAAVGLVLVWLFGWWQGKKVNRRLFNEELYILKRELEEKEGSAQPTEESIEEMVQKAIRERFK